MREVPHEEISREASSCGPADGGWPRLGGGDMGRAGVRRGGDRAGPGVYERFRVKARTRPWVSSSSPVIRSKSSYDSTTTNRKHDGVAHASRPGIHHREKGTLTFYEYDDPTCTPHVDSQAEGYVDRGHGHVGRNESGQPARDITVILAPPGGRSARA